MTFQSKKITFQNVAVRIAPNHVLDDGKAVLKASFP
jgi:hypothetical protein